MINRFFLISLLICMACAAGNKSNKRKKNVTKTNSVGIQMDTVRSGEMRVE